MCCNVNLQAIKIVDKTTRRRLGRSQLSNEQKIRREIAIMKKCIHPNVVRLIEVIDDPNARKIYLGKGRMPLGITMRSNCGVDWTGLGHLPQNVASVNVKSVLLP